ncbi:hypothetical protein V8F33_012903 [Rhypophila sp. PSN 637]
MDKSSESPKKRDRTNENFARARNNTFQRCDKISRQYGADIYILVRRRQYHDEYSSLDAPSWPPSKLELVRPERTFEDRIPNTRKEQVYPVPRITTTANFCEKRQAAESRSSAEQQCNRRVEELTYREQQLTHKEQEVTNQEQQLTNWGKSFLTGNKCALTANKSVPTGSLGSPLSSC